MSLQKLSDHDEAEQVTVERVFEEDEELLKFFENENIKPGATIIVLEKATYRGTITIQINKKEIVLGLQAASRIWTKDR